MPHAEQLESVFIGNWSLFLPKIFRKKILAGTKKK